MRVEAGYVSAGTGFIFDTEEQTGFVVTAHHVVEDGSSFDVIVQGRSYEGTLLGFNSDGTADIAVLSICCRSDFHSIPWESGETPMAGTRVMAMGRPRDVPISTTGKVVDDSVGLILDLIAHDAPIQSGSSGGPLLAMDGKVLGVNVSGSTIKDNVYYAVPYDKVAQQVLEWKSRLVVVAPHLTPEADPSDLIRSEVGDTELFWEIPKGRYILTATIKANSGSFSDYLRVSFENVVDGESWRFSESDAAEGIFSYLVNVGDGSEPSYDRHLLAGRHLVKVDTTSDRAVWSISFEPVE